MRHFNPSSPEWFPDELRDSTLLEQAFTHRSVGAWNYERIEFIGDAVLDLIIAWRLFELMPNATEGVLSKSRSYLVCAETLSGIARKHGIPALIRASPGVAALPSVQADTLEALIGACFLHAGFETTRKMVRALYGPHWERPPAPGCIQDPKTALQEWAQQRKVPRPMYHVLRTSGPDHNLIFEVECRVAGLSEPATGHGPSRRAAEKNAAANVLQQLRS